MNPGRILILVLVLLAFVALAPKSCAQVMLPHRHGGAVPVAPLPLDIITTPPYGVYSVARKLKTAYGGPAYRVIRMSDTNILDVGFTSDNLVDTNSLLSWLGSGTNAAYLGVLYDQSTNAWNLNFPDFYGDANFGTHAALIASNSVMIVDEQGRPTSKWPGNVNYSYIRANSVALMYGTNSAYYMVGEIYNNSGGEKYIVNLGPSPLGALTVTYYRGIRLYGRNGGTDIGPTIALNQLFLATAYFGVGSVSFVQVNLDSPVYGTATGLLTYRPEIGWGSTPGIPSAASKISEWWVWQVTPDTNTWQIVQSSAMSFYNIQPQPTPPVGQVDNWMMDDSTGFTATDAGSLAADFPLFGFVTWMPTGHNGNGGSLNFDGSSGYGKMADSYAGNRFTNNFTYALWVKSDNTNQVNRYLLSRDNIAGTQEASVIYGWAAKQIEFFATGYTGSDPRTGSQLQIDDLNWHHVAYTYDGVTYAGYKDGTNVFSVARTFALNPAAADYWSLACDYTTSASAFFKGTLDDIQLYNRALTGAEITALFNQ